MSDEGDPMGQHRSFLRRILCLGSGICETVPPTVEEADDSTECKERKKWM